MEQSSSSGVTALCVFYDVMRTEARDAVELNKVTKEIRAASAWLCSASPWPKLFQHFLTV
jgi:hypothetical protein